MIIFSGQPGRVVRINDPGVPATVSGPVSIENWGGFNSLRAIISHIGCNYECNYQFMHTLGGSIYVYSFGDKIGNISINGVAFNNGCGSSDLGIDRVRQFYQANKLSNRASPMKVSIGSSTMLGMLIGMSDTATPGEMPMYQFGLNFALIPDPANDEESESGGKFAGGNSGIEPNPNSQPAAGGGDQIAQGGQPRPRTREERMAQYQANTGVVL